MGGKERPLSGQGLRVLIVEDNTAVCLLLKEMLSDHEVVVAVTKEEALAWIEELRLPDLVLCDYDLPDGTGVEVLKKIRAVSPQSRLILMSGMAPHELPGRAREAGADLWWSKPISDSVLCEEVDRLLAHHAPRVAPP
jgi:CheY-like chemotaxis protein